MTDRQIQFEVTEDYQLRITIPEELNALAGFINAVGSSNVQAVEEFLQKDARVRERMSGAGILSMASFLGCTEIAALMIDHGADVNETIDEGWTPLMKAVRMGNAETARLLIDKGADVNAACKHGLTVLIIAVVADDVECTRLLIDNRVDLSMCTDTGTTAQVLAETNNRTEILQLLNEYAARPHALALKNQQKLKAHVPKPVIIRGMKP